MNNNTSYSYFLRKAERSLTEFPMPTSCSVWCGTVKMYSLSDKHGHIFYIGCTTSPLKVRLSCHLSVSGRSVRSNIWKANKIEQLDNYVTINLIEEYYATGQTAWHAKRSFLKREQYWINKHIEMGCTLFNIEAIKLNKSAYTQYKPTT